MFNQVLMKIILLLIFKRSECFYKKQINFRDKSSFKIVRNECGDCIYLLYSKIKSKNFFARIINQFSNFLNMDEFKNISYNCNISKFHIFLFFLVVSKFFQAFKNL